MWDPCSLSWVLGINCIIVLYQLPCCLTTTLPELFNLPSVYAVEVYGPGRLQSTFSRDGAWGSHGHHNSHSRTSKAWHKTMVTFLVWSSCWSNVNYDLELGECSVSPIMVRSCSGSDDILWCWPQSQETGPIRSVHPKQLMDPDATPRELGIIPDDLMHMPTELLKGKLRF